jgi:hypothetical protein
MRHSKTVKAWEMKDKNCQNVRSMWDLNFLIILLSTKKFINVLLTEIGGGMLKFIVLCVNRK